MNSRYDRDDDREVYVRGRRSSAQRRGDDFSGRPGRPVADASPSAVRAAVANQRAGTVKTLRDGFGFIRGDDGVEYFFHRTALSGSGVRFEELQENSSRVIFTPIAGEKGPRAIDVRPE